MDFDRKHRSVFALPEDVQISSHRARTWGVCKCGAMLHVLAAERSGNEMLDHLADEPAMGPTEHRLAGPIRHHDGAGTVDGQDPLRRILEQEPQRAALFAIAVLQSDLLALAIRDVGHYANDPRRFRLWHRKARDPPRLTVCPDDTIFVAVRYVGSPSSDERALNVRQIVRVHVPDSLFHGLDDFIRTESVHSARDVVGFECPTSYVVPPRPQVRGHQSETEFVLARLQGCLRTCTFDRMPYLFSDDASELDLPAAPDTPCRLLDAERRKPSPVPQKSDCGERGDLGCQKVASFVVA